LPLTISYLTLTLPDLPYHLVQGTAMCGQERTRPTHLSRLQQTARQIQLRYQ